MILNFKCQEETLFKPLCMKEMLGLHVKRSIPCPLYLPLIVFFICFVCSCLLDSSLLSNFLSGQ